MDIENWYAALDGNGFVQQFESVTEESEGPNLPQLGPFQYLQLPGRPDVASQPTLTSRLRLNDGAPVWVETAPLSELQASAVAQTYKDVDAVYEAAVGRREPEYTPAAVAARAYLAAELHPEDEIVSDFITGHALSKGKSYMWAAQQIVERADAFKWAIVQLRNVRFARQTEMEAATTPAELNAAVAEWNEFIKWLRTVLGL